MNYFRRPGGFSMVEAMVAITVLTIGVVYPLSLMANFITDANYAKNQITAFFLAQEGLELVINFRDNNRFNGRTAGNREVPGTYWLGGSGGTGLGPCIDRNPSGSNNVDFCYVSTLQPDQFIACESDGQCPNLTIDENGIYGYGAGEPSGFNRQIQITPFLVTGESEERGAVVRVIIRWRDKNIPREFKLNSVIYR